MTTSEGGCWTIVTVTQPLERGAMSWGTSPTESPILKVFPTARPRNTPPVEHEDLLAGSSLSGGARPEILISRQYNKWLK